MKKPTVYLIGPTLFISKLNIQSFEAVENALAKRGFSVVKPHDLFATDEQTMLSDDEVITRRCNALAKCDFAVLISGYEEDKFARAEKAVANVKQVPVHAFLEGVDRFSSLYRNSAA